MSLRQRNNPFSIHAGTASGITATAGTPQSAIIQTVYGEPLQVTVTDTAGTPVNGVAVVFAAPASGPGLSFSGQSTITVNADAQGHAAAVITANNIAGRLYCDGFLDCHHRNRVV